MARVRPGEVVDAKGVPIYPGDLVREFHFRAAHRRKKFYLYHVATWNEVEQTIEMIPTSHLEKSCIKSGGRYWLTQDMADETEMLVIDGYGPGSGEHYSERQKRRVAKPPTEASEP